MNQKQAGEYAQLGATYLLNQIQPNGRFVYNRGRDGKPITGKYNILRHAGALWALRKVLPPSIRQEEFRFELPGIYLESKYYHTELGEILIKDKETIKLGGCALAYLAMEEPLLIKGVKTFIDKPTGMIKFSKVDMEKCEVSPWESEYYPGEAALALVMAGEYELALKVIQNLWYTRDREKPLQDHWLMQAIGELLKANGEPGAIRFNDSGLFHYMGNLEYEITINPLDYINRACPLACRLEGLISAYEMLRNPLTLDLIIKYMDRLLEFQDHYPASKTFGAFLDKGGYRIDYTQHAIMALHRFSNLKL